MFIGSNLFPSTVARDAPEWVICVLAVRGQLGLEAPDSAGDVPPLRVHFGLRLPRRDPSCLGSRYVL
jgi:hypothetical protein